MLTLSWVLSYFRGLSPFPRTESLSVLNPSHLHEVDEEYQLEDPPS